MKRYYKTIGLILALLLIYYIVQVIAGISIVFYYDVLKSIAWSITGEQLDILRILNQSLDFLLSNTALIIIISTIITFIIYSLIYRKRKSEMKSFIRFKGIRPYVVLLIIFFGLSFNMLIDAVISKLSEISVLRELFESYYRLNNTLTNGNFVLGLIGIGIMGPIFEEILFRGLILGELKKITKVQLAIILQAVLFGVYHMNVIQGVFAAIIGLALGYVYDKYDSIIASMLLHITINTSSVIIGYIISEALFERWGITILTASLMLFVITSFIMIKDRGAKQGISGPYYPL